MHGPCVEAVIAADRAALLAQLGEENPEALLADGFEEAFVGICRRFGQPPLAAYDVEKCLAVLMERDGMDYEGAQEFFEYNVIGAGLGENTPVFMTLKADE